MARFRSVSVAGVLGALALVLIVAPATFADTKIGTYGSPGPNGLRDSKSNPGVSCSYVKVGSDDISWAGKLTHLTVKPPKMATAHPGIAQKVDWSFVVQRIHNGNYTQTYQSPFYSATAPANGNWAPLVAKGVAVNVPADYQNTVYKYRVLVTLEWYTGTNAVNAGVQRRDDYYLIIAGGDPQTFGVPKTPCEAYIVIAG
jgi:hypothetical protein